MPQKPDHPFTFPRGPHPAPYGQAGKLRGNPTGRNHGSSGYVNNTRAVVPDAGDEGPDRHCVRPTSKGVMKCARCYDYNKGVRCGVCFACNYNRFDVDELEEALGVALGSAELEDAALALCFEEAVERNRWSEEEARSVGTNTHAVHLCVKEVFAGKAMVHKEGSVRKNTATNASDVDLMVTLSSRKKMSDAERDDLLRALSKIVLFREVRLGRNAIKITPHQGPNLDVVAHHSAFELSPNTLAYLRPAGVGFWGKPGAALAVSGLKIWWNRVKSRVVLSVYRLQPSLDHEWSQDPPARIPGHVWESIVLGLEEELHEQATGDQETCKVKSGFDYFLQAMQLLASDASGSSTTWNYPLGDNPVAADWGPIREEADAALAVWGEERNLRAFGM